MTELMLATMISVEKLDGLYELEGGMDVVLMDDLTGVARVHLTMAASPYVAELDRSEALGILVASGHLGGLPGCTHGERFMAALELAKRQRARAEPSTASAYAIVTASEAGVTVLGGSRTIEIAEFAVGYNLFDETSLRRKSDRARDAALSALSLFLDRDVTATSRSLGEYSFLEPGDSGRRLYNRTLKVHGSVTSQVVLRQVQFEAVTSAASHLASAPELSDVAHLLSSALDAHRTGLERFVAAFAGLEFLATSAVTPGSVMFLGPHGSPQPRRLPLRKAFESLARTLDSGGAETDIATFEALTRARNAYYHKMEGDPRRLEHARAAELLRKYLRLALN